MTVKTTAWAEMFPANYRLVTVARDGGRTIIGNRAAIWNADALRPYVPTIPGDGYYELRGRKFTETDASGMPTGQALYDALAEAEGRDDAPVTITGWGYRGDRVLITPAGQIRSIPEGVADLAIGLLDLRSATDPDGPLAAYRYTDDGQRLVGLIQGYSGYRDDPIMAAIAACGDYYAAT
ncbi:hypothetical protein [Glycomyces tenuis]|uniref:hypothetical protein n=1 Tax=Glycomyces tenuis TaxID=58116 RepID=UPI00041DF260|nr:hypothetical protein [Glycomyces tenuis]